MEIQKRDKKGRYLPKKNRKQLRKHVIGVTSEEKELIEKMREQKKGVE